MEADQINFGIVIPTYNNSRINTPECLTKALVSIKNQTYKNFKVFLIGDKYEPESDILKILNCHLDLNIEFTNLSSAKEREQYTTAEDVWNLWNCGGVNASNIGITKALSEKIEYICHLDHDDWWEPNHLQSFADCINTTQADFMCTTSTHIPRHIPRDQNVETHFLPFLNSNNHPLYTPITPAYCALIRSSVCMNFKTIPLLYRDAFKETGTQIPSDGDLWNRVATYKKENDIQCMFINKVTCHHDSEGSIFWKKL
jgi:glycosyltransferase involved in cell wall biosynthesis